MPQRSSEPAKPGKKRKTIATAAIAGAAAAALAAGALLLYPWQPEQAAKQAGPAQSSDASKEQTAGARKKLPADNSYAENREARKMLDFLRWLKDYKDSEGLKMGKVSLDDMIEYYGFRHHKSNVAALEDAELIIFGEYHRLMGDELSGIFSCADLKESDKVLVEDYDFAIDFSKIGEQKHGDKEKKSLREMIEDLTSSLEKLGYVESRDGDEQNYFSVLALESKGRVIGVDAPRETKLQHLYTWVQQTMLGIARQKIRNNEPLHEFEEWLLYKDLELFKPDSAGSEKIAKMESFRKDLPQQAEVGKKRDMAIAKKTIDEVYGLQKGSKAYMVFGTGHVEAETLLGELEGAGIKYVAFVPDKERNFSRDTTRPAEQAKKQHSIEYLEGTILPWYVRERVADGKPAYAGSFKGVVPQK